MGAPVIYELRKPKELIPNKQYPCLFVMHGIGSNEQNMLPLIQGLEDHFYIFSIRGHLQQAQGFAYFSIQAFGKPHRDVFDEGIAKLSSFIDFVCEQYPIDVSQLYLLGFSQGAIVSMTLGLMRGNSIKGIIALSGYIPQFVKEEYDKQSLERLALFISHGQFDQVLPYEWGKENAELFRNLHASVTFNTYAEGHTVSKQNVIDFQTWLLNDLNR
ncbi:alpha/beta hydrolase [Heyndrickxia ginsengihumi]|uniref:alpha/beta hydrolase n=1 Tax=Heyndrickxia ginsengihumi TaxID=363870 RepID=UPI000470AFCA|nr:hypothetical protein [Heyndrickxia ginsengihumi]